MTRTDFRGSVFAWPLLPEPPSPVEAVVGAWMACETGCCGTSSRPDASAKCSRGTSGIGLNIGTLGPRWEGDDTGVGGEINAAPVMSVRPERLVWVSIRVMAGPDEESAFCASSRGRVFESRSGMHSWSGLEVSGCGVLIQGRVWKK